MSDNATAGTKATLDYPPGCYVRVFLGDFAGHCGRVTGPPSDGIPQTIPILLPGGETSVPVPIWDVQRVC